jgi:hypothetical protein
MLLLYEKEKEELRLIDMFLQYGFYQPGERKEFL